MAEALAEQCCHGESERDGHADVAEIEHRRMHDHQHVVLQQRIGTGTIRRRIEHRQKRIGRRGDEEAEERAAAEPRADGVRHVVLVLAGHQPRRAGDVEAEDAAPEEDRALQR